MNSYIGYQSALAIYASKHFPLSGSREDSFTLPTDHRPHVSLVEAAWLSERFNVPTPLHVCVPADAARRNSSALVCHAISPQAGSESFIHLGKETYLASPLLALLQTAVQVDKLALVLALSESCSRFVLDNDTVDGFRERDPLTSCASIEDYASSLKNIAGTRILAYAASLAIENARSPAEVKLALRLSLPEDLGGYGLPKPVVNANVPLGSSSALESREVDLLWEEQRLVVEYDSESFHGAEERERDAARANELIDAGYTVISATKGQVNNAIKMDRLAANIASHLYCDEPPSSIEHIRKQLLEPPRQVAQKRASLQRELDRLCLSKPWRAATAEEATKARRQRERANQRRRERYRKLREQKRQREASSEKGQAAESAKQKEGESG